MKPVPYNANAEFKEAIQTLAQERRIDIEVGFPGVNRLCSWPKRNWGKPLSRRTS